MHGERSNYDVLDDEALHGGDSSSSSSSSSLSSVYRFRYERRGVKIVVRPPPFAVSASKSRGSIHDGGNAHGIVVLEGELIMPNSVKGAPYDYDTVCLFMHPAAVMNMLPFPASLARAGVPCMTCHSRYANFDYNLEYENVIYDLGCAVRHCKEKLRFKRVVLVGWSGGGSLCAYYQAHSLKVCGTDLEAFFPPAEALVIVAAHAGRARILTECLDPSLYLLRRGSHPKQEAKLRRFDLYGKNSPKPPYTAQFLKQFRRAQKERNARITAWAKENPGKSFVVDGTMADPRWIHPAIDPNDRTMHYDCYLGDPRVANDSVSVFSS